MATATVPGHLRAALLGMEGHWIWYRRRWYTTVFSSIVSPLLFLVAMGIGFGSQVRPGAFTDGQAYLVWIAPAVLVAGALQNAAGESSWPVFSGFKWQKQYWAITATPTTPAELFAGQQLWVQCRVILSALVFVLIAACLGAVTSVAVLCAVPVAALTAGGCSALIMALAATIRNEGNGFNVLFRFVIVPMTLFSGTFFPVDTLPVFVRPLAWITPLFHGTSLARELALGTGSPGSVLGHLGYLVVLLGVGLWLGTRQFRRRLVV